MLSTRCLSLTRRFADLCSFVEMRVLVQAFRSQAFVCVFAMARCLLSFGFIDVLMCASMRADSHSSAPLAARIAEQFPEASSQVVAGALQAALSAENVPLSEAECVRDYSLPCPMNWVDAGDGGTCLAPDAYAGPCGESTDYRGLSAHEKMLAASRCGAAFPCVGGCAPDYSAACPVGWSEASGVCEAPADYSGPCIGKKGLANVNAIGKTTFATSCAVHWPCRGQRAHASLAALDRQCSMDFTDACPEGWASRGSVCIAPSDYQGPCPIASPFGEYTDNEKSVVAKACFAPWPCRG